MVKDLPANARDVRDSGSIPGLGRSPGEGNGNAFQYSCLENPIDREAWGLQSIGSQRVRHDWSNLAHAHKCVWSPTGEKQGGTLARWWFYFFFVEELLNTMLKYLQIL